MSNKSKTGGKDKKKDGDSELEKIIQQQKRQILQQTFTIKKLQDRLSRLTQQNFEIVSTKDKFHSDYEEKIDKNRILIQSHQNTIKEKSNKIYELQVQKINLINKVKNLQRDVRQLEATRIRQFEEYKRLTQSQISKLENQLKQYNFYMAERDQMETQNEKLKRNLDEQKQTKVRQVADKERQKVQATDKLRDEMLTKIRDMRTNLLSLKKQQLSTTTRLAVLQNHQLTSELEFQSKQSQKLIFENQHLTKKVNNLQKDLQIHKEIEEQLAKRSHYSRGIIKKLTAKIGQLEQDLESIIKRDQNKGETEKSKGWEERDSVIVDNDKRQEMIKVLDKSLQYSQKKYVKVQSENETLKNEIYQLKMKVQKYEKKSQDLLELLFKYYQQELKVSNQNNGLETSGMKLDLKSMRKRKINQWTPQQARFIVTILLNKISSKINRKSLGIPIINNNAYTVQDQDELIQRVKFPRISQHSAITKLSTTNINVSSSALQIKKLKDLPLNMASKIVGSNVRQWGRTVHANSVSHLSRKYKIIDK